MQLSAPMMALSLLGGILAGVFSVTHAAAADMLPPNSVVAAVRPGETLHLVSALEAGARVTPGGWSLHDTAWTVAPRSMGAKVGRDALAFRGTARQTGKGDFIVGGPVPGETLALGGWFYLAENANVREVGFQVYDHEGEALLYLAPVEGTGWRWIEAPLTGWKQAYPQADKNQTPDMPLKSVNIIWWSQESGPSEVIVDGVIARVRLPEEARPAAPTVELTSATDAPLGEAYGGSLLVANPSDQPQTAHIELSLQRDGSLYDAPLPDPLHGDDLAYGARSWTVADGKTIAENTLTDGLDYTAAETAYRSGYWKSAEQVVELDRPRRVTALGWLAGDANWVWKVDVLASVDGETFTEVPELQGVELHGRWGEQRFPAFAPFRARWIKLRYHRDGAKMDVVRMPAALRVWDGINDESFALPQAGDELDRRVLVQEIPARGFAVVAFEFKPKLTPGQYLLAGKVRLGETTRLLAQPVFVEPPLLEGVDAESRFGVNGSRVELAPELRKLGVGWVRFENFKWPFVSPAAHQYAFDGSVQPWVVNVDQITHDYRQAGLYILPMMFLTPQWASGADKATAGSMLLSQPPQNNADFGEFVFQSVARYGARRVDPALLKTKDRLSGLGRIRYFELGNEPNLNPLRDPERPPTWGPWAGTMEQWWTMWRYGAEAVKKADPHAVVVSPGFAGATAEIVDQLRLHTYADGVRPLDLVDVLSVHFYSGRTPPEIATADVNNAQGYEVSFVEHLKRLVEWRDRHKPGAPIWMTETGYDTGGPIGTNERLQAARLPRVVALCLANGVDKVMVYRESGATPSQHAASGLLRNDLSRRPSWYTYATLIRQLHGARPGRRLPHPDPNVWLQTWRRDGKTMLMAYTVTGQGKLDLDLGAARVTDAFGGVREVDSTHDLPLSEFPCYLSDLTNESAVAPLEEQAAKLDRQRARQRQADAQRRVYLFNFGEPHEPAALDMGRLRYYQPVPANTLYRQETGFGFVNSPAARNDYRHWMAAPVERYAVQVDQSHVFQFDVAPGRYELRMNAAPTHGPSKITLEGADEGPVTLHFIPDKSETLSRAITVSGDALRLRFAGRHLLRWLVLEEKPAK